MKVFKLSEMVKGWFIGDFEPSIIKTKDFEVGVLDRPPGLERPKHFHKEAVEISVMVEGRAKINGTEINVGDIFLLEKGEVVDAEFYEKSRLVVVKTPSVIGDKYLVEQDSEYDI